MTLETLAGFLALRPLQRFFGFRTAMSKTVLCRLLPRLTPFGLLARGAKVDDGAHVTLDGNQMLGRPGPFGLG